MARWRKVLGSIAASSAILASSAVATVGQAAAAGAQSGYRLVTSGGETFSFGASGALPSPGRTGSPIVASTPTPSGEGAWLAAANGSVFALGDAGFFGSANTLRLNQPVVGMAATPTGRGYWLVGRDGGVFSYGDARFFGSTGNIRLNQPIVGMASSPTGAGYWFVASDGGVFSYGDARFFGSTGNIRLNQPVVGMASTTAGQGYWLVARDGGVFSYGDARFFGSTGNIRLNQPIVGTAATPGGNGYRFVAADGGVFSFGDATFLGSTGGRPPGSPVVAIVAAAKGDVTTGPAPAPLVPAGVRLFAADSAFNSPIGPNPALDPAGPAQVAYLSGARHPGIADLYEFGVPVWDADASTPRYRVDCLKPWGTCGLERELVPVPAGAFASPGSDAAMVVVDWSTRRSYEFWEAAPVGGTWQAGWGDVVGIDGPGTPSGAVGAGISRLAGVVRAFEMAQGRIDHALVFSTDNACQRVYRFPASKTDGNSARPDCIPEGARLQLDPAVNVDALPGLTPGERIVARALQTYGAYAIDNGGAKMAFIFEQPSGEADPYPGVGFTRDYFGMDRIPWSLLRVLRSWDGR